MCVWWEDGGMMDIWNYLCRQKWNSLFNGHCRSKFGSETGVLWHCEVEEKALYVMCDVYQLLRVGRMTSRELSWLEEAS